ncbi:hypothetical protein IJJ08_00835 [bacterium]|nr:hypothetical protein [bacterium]
MTVVTTAYQPPTPDLLLLALQHYDGVQDRVDELLGLSDQSLAELTRSLLKKAARDYDPVAADLGMTHKQLQAALKVGGDDLDAGRVMSVEQLDRQMKAKYPFLCHTK